MILIVANIGSAVVLFPILKRQNESLALGYVTARVVESVFIGVGILGLFGKRVGFQIRHSRTALYLKPYI